MHSLRDQQCPDRLPLRKQTSDRDSLGPGDWYPQRVGQQEVLYRCELVWSSAQDNLSQIAVQKGFHRSEFVVRGLIFISFAQLHRKMNPRARCLCSPPQDCQKLAKFEHISFCVAAKCAENREQLELCAQEEIAARATARRALEPSTNICTSHRKMH